MKFSKKKAVLIFKRLIKFFQIFFPKKNGVILCFDCLYDKNQEQIDAYTFFKYLRKNNIKTKYISLNDSVLEDDLNNKDIIFVKNKWEFLFRYFFLILSSKAICTSFGLFDEIDSIFKKCKSFDYIFIEHGVTYFKSNTLNLFNAHRYNKILVPTKLTYELYKENNHFKDEDMIFSGLPRWDNLAKNNKKYNRIFVFFTWRKAFLDNSDCALKYVDKIIENLNIIADKTPSEVEICFAWHHEILKNNVAIKKPNKRIKLIDTKKISSIIKESDLLITDFSSVSFDYFYLSKPVIYYRFDCNEDYLNDIDKLNYAALGEFDKRFPNCVYSEKEFMEKIDLYLSDYSKFTENSAKIHNEIFWDFENNSERLCDKLISF